MAGLFVADNFCKTLNITEMKNQSQKTPLSKAEKETILMLLNSLLEEVRTAIQEIRVVKSMIEKGGVSC